MNPAKEKTQELLKLINSSREDLKGSGEVIGTTASRELEKVTEYLELAEMFAQKASNVIDEEIN